jgi:RNA polymerase sigma factor for flagellar operon FliA
MNKPTRAPEPGRGGVTLEASNPGSDEQLGIAGLWHDYKAGGDEALRERLILHYSPLVKYVAGRVSMGLPPNTDPADCFSFGVFGLIDAIEKFEPHRGAAFEPYAIRRIRGAIFDELRALDWIPRSVRAKARAVERAYGAAQARLGRTPSEAEIAEELGVPTAELAESFSQLSALNVLALDELLGTGENAASMSLGESLADLGSPDPATVFETHETRRVLIEALARLSEREQILIRLYYFDGFTLADVGTVLGVSESRVCQMHAKAMLALRAQLA